MRVYALYDYGDLVDLYSDPAVAEIDADALRTQARDRNFGETPRGAAELNHYIKVHEFAVREAPQFGEDENSNGEFS